MLNLIVSDKNCSFLMDIVSLTEMTVPLTKNLPYEIYFTFPENATHE